MGFTAPKDDLDIPEKKGFTAPDSDLDSSELQKKISVGSGQSESGQGVFTNSANSPTPASGNGGFPSASEAQSTSTDGTATDPNTPITPPTGLPIQYPIDRPRQREVEILKDKTAKIFQSNPVFQDPVARDTYYKKLSEIYSPEEIKGIVGDDVRPPSSPDKGFFDMTGFDPVKQVSEAATEGVKSGLEKYSKASEQLQHLSASDPFYDAGKALLNVAQGSAEIVLGGLTPFVAPLAAFTIGAPVAAKLTNGVSDYFTQPASTILNKVYTEKGLEPPEWAKNATALTDFAYGIGAFFLIHKLLEPKGVDWNKANKIQDKVKSGEKLTADEQSFLDKGIQQTVEKMNPEQIDKGAVVSDTRKQVADVDNQISSLNTDIANNPDLTNILAPKVQELADKGAQLHDNLTNTAVTEAADEAHKDMAVRGIQKLETRKQGMSDVGKEALDGEIATLSKQLEELNPATPTAEVKTEAEPTPIAPKEGESTVGEKPNTDENKIEAERQRKELLSPSEIPSAEPATAKSPKDAENQAGKDEANRTATDLGYDHASHLLNAIEKETGVKYENVQDVPKKELEKARRYDKGKTAFEVLSEKGIEPTEAEYNKAVAKHSENPLEIVQTFREENNYQPTKDYIGSFIDDNITMTRKDYSRWGDVNSLNERMRKKFIRPDAQPLDTRLDEISETAGKEITPQMVIDHIENFGKGKYIPETSLRVELKNRFKEVTGKTLTPKLEQEIINKSLKQIKDVSEQTDETKWTDAELDAYRSQIPYFESEGEYQLRQADLVRSQIESAESKANSNSETELNEAIQIAERIEAGADRAIDGQPEPPVVEPETKPKVEQSLGDKIRKGKIEDDLLMSGVPFAKEVWNGAVEILATAVDKGEVFASALKKAIEHIKQSDWYKGLSDEHKGRAEKKFLEEQSKKQESKEAGITHEETSKIRDEFSLGDYEKSTKTNAELESEANTLLEKGYDIESLIKKLEDGKLPSDVEQTIMKKYLSGLADKVEKNPTDSALLEQARRAVQASDKIGGSEVGRSLQARKGLKTRDQSLLDYFMQEQDLNKDAPLTDNQKSVVIKEFNDIKEAKEALEKKLADLEDAHNKLKAKKEVEKTIRTSRRGRKTTEEHIAYRKKITEDISEKLRKMRGEMQSSIVPYARELTAIAPDVAKLVKDHIEEGVEKFEDVVSKIHENLKTYIPDVTKEDVQDIIAGKYNEKKSTRNEATRKRYEFIQQAKLTEKLSNLVNGIEPTIEKRKIQRNQEIEDLRKQVKEHDLTKLAEYKNRLKNQIEKIDEDLRTGNLEPDKPVTKPPLDAEALKLKDAYIKKRQEREIRIMRQRYENRSAYEKSKDRILEVANIPRTLMSSMDFSAPLRQGVVATTAHPMIASKAFGEMFRQAVSQKRFDRWFYDVKDDPRYPMSKESGLYIADPHDPRLSIKEEAFMNNLAEKIPIAGRLIKGSERAYVGYLNKLRWDLFNHFSDILASQGKTFENNPKLYKGLADYVNNSTGRGKLHPSLETTAPLLNSAFFAPRLIASRLNFLNPVYYARLPKEIRIQALKDVGKFIGVGLSVMALAKLNGAQVESDPRSSDFGKIKSGNTRWDIWGGHQQYIRVLTQLLTGQSKSATTGQINEINGTGRFGESRGDVALRFLRGKLAPLPSIGADILSGRTISGEKPTIGLEAQQHLLPLLYGDVQEAVKDRGLKAIFTAGIPSMFGVGVQTYLPKDKSTTATPSNKITLPKKIPHRL